jgi:hypothetical protein
LVDPVPADWAHSFEARLCPERKTSSGTFTFPQSGSKTAPVHDDLAASRRASWMAVCCSTHRVAEWHRSGIRRVLVLTAAGISTTLIL